MPDKKEKSWFRRHWFLTGILGFFALMILIGMFQGVKNSAEDDIKYSGYTQDGLVVASASSLLPQDSEIDRIWKIGSTAAIESNATGFVEGAEKRISKTESFGATSIILSTYCFGSSDDANQFYNQEQGKINIRGVDDWSLGDSCFGIQRDSGLSGFAEGLCLRNNVVFYVKASSNSYSYASDGKSFMKIMLKKI